MQKNIEIVKACQNNLKAVNVKIPLGSFTVICGLSRFWQKLFGF